LSLTLCLAASLAYLSGCASATQRADAIAQLSRFRKQIVQGAPFRHVVYRNSAVGTGAVLHVYIEGDGTPVMQGDIIAADPTPHDPLMLRLMSEDSAPSLYLGRPCYFGLHADLGCSPADWTFHRFSPDVLDSMEAVLRAEITRTGATRVDLFGHSGGGTIAVLLGERVDSVVRVVTIGPTLDVSAWCKLHGYSPLIGSLNPVGLPARRSGLDILHLVGARDTNTPPSFVEAAAARRGERVEVIADADHHCCWQATWHGVLDAEPIARTR
jgi:pimeloyl-ACP methyl ester carboxylesterase